MQFIQVEGPVKQGVPQVRTQYKSLAETKSVSF
jgi:hypothetical protein